MHSHTAYELIPESGKVVLLDVDLPVRQVGVWVCGGMCGWWRAGWLAGWW
jgi:hypothetical protein